MGSVAIPRCLVVSAAIVLLKPSKIRAYIATEFKEIPLKRRMSNEHVFKNRQGRECDGNEPFDPVFPHPAGSDDSTGQAGSKMCCMAGT